MDTINGYSSQRGTMIPPNFAEIRS